MTSDQLLSTALPAATTPIPAGPEDRVSAPRAPRRGGRLKGRAVRLAIAGAALGGLLTTFAGVASADSFNPGLHNTTYTWSDCNIDVGFIQDTHDGAAWGSIAGSTMTCNSPHTFWAQQVLTFNGVIQPGHTRIWKWTDTYGFGRGQILETQARCGAGTWGSILYFSNGSKWYSLNNVPQYVATGC